MADYDSSLPVQTLNNGDVVVKLVDGTVNTQYWNIDANGIGQVNLNDGTNTLVLTTGGGITSTIYDSTGVNAWEIDANNLGPVKVTDGTNDLAINAGGSINVNIVSAVVANEFHQYNTSSAIAPNTPTNVVNYTVVATTALVLRDWSVACSGRAKAELKTGPTGSETTKAVAFLSTAGGTWEGHFDSAIEVVNGDKVLVVMTNRDNANTDLYAWINGNLV